MSILQAMEIGIKQRIGFNRSITSRQQKRASKYQSVKNGDKSVKRGCNPMSVYIKK